MTLVGCDLHSRKQQVAVLDTNTGEVLEEELAHDGDAVERFYRALPPPVTIGIETTGYTQWFHALMHRLGHTVLVGEAAKIRAMVVRKRRPIGGTLGTCLTFSSTTASRRCGSRSQARVICAP
jgi:transposase